MVDLFRFQRAMSRVLGKILLLIDICHDETWPYPFPGRPAEGPQGVREVRMQRTWGGLLALNGARNMLNEKLVFASQPWDIFYVSRIFVSSVVFR